MVQCNGPFIEISSNEVKICHFEGVHGSNGDDIVMGPFIEMRTVPFNANSSFSWCT